MGVTRYVLPFLFITAIILGIAYGKDEVLVRSCPQDKSSWDTAARRKECKPEGGQNYEYHCVKNERQELVETCMVAQWIEKGVCPILFDSGSFGAENCTSRTFLGPCPTMVYRSNEVYTFLLCFVSTTMTTSATRTTTEMKTTLPTSSPVEEKETTTSIPYDSGKIAGIVLGVLFASVVAGIVVWKSRIRSLTKCRRQDIEQGSKIEEPVTEPLVHSSKKSVQPERIIVQLAAYAKGKQILTENGILVITGKVGSGKSTAMNRIIQLLNDDQCDEMKWKVEEALSWNKELQYEGQVMITWDDCFGQFVTYPTKKENTKQRIKEIVKWIKVDDKNRKIILIMSETSFDSCNVKQILEKAGFETDCKVCLDTMSNDEKSSLVATTSEFIRGSSVVKDNILYEVKTKLHELSNKEDDESVKLCSLGWPLICRLATIPYIANDFTAFIEDPFTCVQNLFDDLNSTNQNLLLYCEMIGVSFKFIDPEFLRKFKEEIEKNKMHHANEKADFVGMLNSGDAIIKKLRSELNRDPPSAYFHYILKAGEEDFQLFHNIFQLWLLCHFYKQFPELTVQYLDFDLLLELLRPTNHTNERFEEEIAQICGFEDKDEDAVSEEKNKNKNWKFILERNMYDLFFGRVGTKEKSLIENKQNSVLNHPLLDDSTFRKMLQVKFAVTMESNAE